MSLTIVDWDAVGLEAEAKAEAWEAEFQAAFYRPLRVQQATMRFLAASPEEREALAAAEPALHAQLAALAERVMRHG